MKNTILLFALLFHISAYSEIKILTGSFKNLKDIKEFNLVFDYSDLMVDRLSEEDFLKEKMNKRAKNGKDILFREGWFADRENRYEPKFITSFNMRFKKSLTRAEKNLSTAKYTMVIKTNWIHPGFNVGIMHNSAAIKTNIIVYENSNPNNILLSVLIGKVSGKGIYAGPLGFMDYNTGYRISESYAKLAKILSKQIKHHYRNN